MKIAQFIASSGRGGAEKVFCDLYNSICEKQPAQPGNCCPQAIEKCTQKADATVTESPPGNLPHKKLLHKISAADLVSFDIFDTLILRLLYHPEGVFRYIEESSENPGFADARKAAANNARKKAKAGGVEEITLDEIYKQIAPRFQHLKGMEVDLEIANHVRNSELFKAYEFAREQNKTIILTSDMYLPRDVLEEILHNCGYQGYHALFLSQEDGLTKKSGSRFRDILCRFDIAPGKMLHIGDSMRADVKEPELQGIHTFHIKRLNRRMDDFPVSHRLIHRLEKNKTGWSSLIAGCIAHQAHSSNASRPPPSYFYRLGYQYTGPFLANFTLWLADQLKTKGIKQVYFQARDGLIIKKVYDALFDTPPAQSAYLYASRAFFTQLHDDPEQRTLFLDYLDSIGFPKDPNASAVLVDVGRRGTIQRLLKEILSQKGPDLFGFYFDLRTPDHSAMDGFITDFNPRYEKFLDFMDFLLIADHPLITGIQSDEEGFAPQYLPITDDEQVRIQAAREMHSGIVDFVKTAKPILTRFPIRPDHKLILEMGRALMKFTDEDKAAFEGMKIASGVRNEKYRPVVPMKLSWSNLTRNSKAFWFSRRKALVRFRVRDLF